MKKVSVTGLFFLVFMIMSFNAGIRYSYPDFQKGGIQLFIGKHLAKNGVKIKELMIWGDGLCHLDISNSTISDLKILSGIPLEKLHIAGTEITDLNPLSAFKELNELDISGTRVTDLAPLRELKRLRKLKMDSVKVSSLSPLIGLPLEELHIRKVSVQDLDLSPIVGMPLRVLCFPCTTVTNANVILQTDIQEILFSPSYIPAEQVNMLRAKNFLKINSYEDNNRFWQEFDKK